MIRKRTHPLRKWNHPEQFWRSSELLQFFLKSCWKKSGRLIHNALTSSQGVQGGKHWILLTKIQVCRWHQAFLKVAPPASAWAGTPGWPHPRGAGWWGQAHGQVHQHLGQRVQLHPLVCVVVTHRWMTRICTGIRLRRWWPSWWAAPVLIKVNLVISDFTISMIQQFISKD